MVTCMSTGIQSIGFTGKNRLGLLLVHLDFADQYVPVKLSVLFTEMKKKKKNTVRIGYRVTGYNDLPGRI